MDHAILLARSSPVMLWVPKQVHIRCFRTAAASVPANDKEGPDVAKAQDADIISISSFFLWPIGAAAEQLKLSQTLLQHLCREHGIHRWPFRRIARLDKVLARILRAHTPPHSPGLRHAQEEITAGGHAIMFEKSRLHFMESSEYR